ncbi:MAG: DUF4190 domain-containing protein [Verrucomicrobia bacterium]|nr:DUF4190 domain-containing protein [Verrucomicrobiota bacterium]MDE3098181.1 DUF4190 domain-containing protein [Verrucomicrobiota bacterium]
MYKIIGTDGREYGPATAEQLRQWVAQGRAAAQTRTLAEGATDWRPLAMLPEFASLFPAGPPTISPPRFPRRNSALATAGLVFGALSWIVCCCYGFPCNLVGLVLSIIALVEINSHPDVYEGRSQAIAGLILAATSILFYGILFTIALATGGFRAQFGHFTMP